MKPIHRDILKKVDRDIGGRIDKFIGSMGGISNMLKVYIDINTWTSVDISVWRSVKLQVQVKISKI